MKKKKRVVPGSNGPFIDRYGRRNPNKYVGEGFSSTSMMLCLGN
jgi:hypothetical protein